MPSPALQKPIATVTNQYWWIVVIVAIVAISVIGAVCIMRGKQFGTYVVLGKAWYGTKINVGCE